MSQAQDAAPRRHTTGTPAGVEQLTAGRALVLHLVFGVLTAALFYVAAPVLMRAGYPAIAAAVVAALVGVVGGELAYLLHRARRRAGRPAPSAVLPYRPGPFTWRKAGLVVGLLVWALAASMLVGGYREAIVDAVFPWMPGWAVDPLPATPAGTAGDTALLVTAVGYLLVLVLAGPVVEELYFRGHLLPRLARFGAWAPLVNVSLFALYHFWKPWDFLTLVVVLLPMVYAVWRTRDVRIGIAVHVALNGLGFVLNVAPALLAG